MEKFSLKKYGKKNAYCVIFSSKSELRSASDILSYLNRDTSSIFRYTSALKTGILCGNRKMGTKYGSDNANKCINCIFNGYSCIKFSVVLKRVPIIKEDIFW